MSNQPERTAGIIRTIKGNVIDLQNFTEDSVDIEDIAWGLGRCLRYNGHIRQDYTVAHHSIIMSYAVPEQNALEALLHDAAEAYIGDLIWPFKALFPEVESFENRMALTIMDRFGVPVINTSNEQGLYEYEKSIAVREADRAIFEHECISMDRPGVWHQHIEDAWLKACEIHEHYWWTSQHAFLQRFQELTDLEDYMTLDMDHLSEVWFNEKVEATNDSDTTSTDSTDSISSDNEVTAPLEVTAANVAELSS